MSGFVSQDLLKCVKKNTSYQMHGPEYLVMKEYIYISLDSCILYSIWILISLNYICQNIFLNSRSLLFLLTDVKTTVSTYVCSTQKNKSFFNELQCTYQSYSHFIKKYLSNFIVTIFHIWNIMILPLNLSTQRDYFLISFKLDVKYIPVPFDITILLNLVLSMRFSLISLPLFLVVIIQNRETFIHWGCKTHL